ncbi:uncharacterized protein GGS22DRAFT_23895 [Annulohypoxylon maeteangense]|uniref:uncharacterized protein n=1 Tax=Annulohypoxylon maeteangense TaxID=1927788 RepID=UPI0020081517|nr:uncharacterized protein GGS22DRAFT_23895 [Annulohypoxylon maeteangense]KAI0884489.1 hypothetical protein GGS22DRAFT_23895 [Annulohypoxylon maeteangense]
MPVPQNKTNFRTYESSVRLLAAVLATAKPKLNYADLAAHMGGGATASAVDHRLRPVKQLAKMQVAFKEAKKDPGELPVDTLEIQKLYGESTAAGIEWQFREIKALGRAQQAAVDQGENPADLKVGPRAKAGPTASTPATAKKTRGGDTPGSKRKRAGKAKMSDDDMDDESESNYDMKDVHSDEESKSPAPKRRSTIVAKANAAKGSATKASTSKASTSKTATPKDATTPAAKKNGNAQSTKSTNGVVRNLFPSSNGKKSTGGSLFGSGVKRVGAKNDVQVIEDSEDDEAQNDKADRKNPQRSCRIKEEAQDLDPDFVDGSGFNDDATSSNALSDLGYLDELDDGEV